MRLRHWSICTKPCKTSTCVWVPGPFFIVIFILRRSLCYLSIGIALFVSRVYKIDWAYLGTKSIGIMFLLPVKHDRVLHVIGQSKTVPNILPIFQSIETNRFMESVLAVRLALRTEVMRA